MLLAAVTPPPPLSAQLSPADSASVLLDAARDFESEERWDVAAAVYQLILDRYAATPAAAEARTRLAAAPSAAASSRRSIEARVWMATYGAWLGVAVPGAFGADGSEPYGIGLLVGAPAGFLAGRAIENALGLTEGQARAITFGGTWGTWQGFGWREVFDLGVAQDCQVDLLGFEFCYDLEDGTQETFTAMIIGGLTGIGVGTLLSQRRLTPGTASVVNFASLWGTWFGVAGGVLMDFEDDDLLAATLVGGDAGLLASALLAPGWNVSRSRARLISISGVLGGLAGAGVDLLVQPDDEKVAIGIPLAGSVLGLVIGAAVTRGDVTTAEGPGAPAGGALVTVDDGRFTFGVPTPVPTLIPVSHGRRPSWQTALSFELLRAAF